MRSQGEMFFINYKNSILGTGGVGTVSREMLKIDPQIRFVFWDGSKPIRREDVSIDVPEEAHTAAHIGYAKLHLWPLLHGLKSELSSRDLPVAFCQAEKVAQIVTEKIADIAGARTEECTYWINDYTSLLLVDRLRLQNPKAKILYSFRTPFGSGGVRPDFSDIDIRMLKGLLSADMITFHRRIDMQTFLSYLSQNYSDVIRNMVMQTSKSEKCDVHLNDGRTLRLVVARMGNNKAYRRELSLNKQAIELKDEIRAGMQKKHLLVGISRFEATKGLEYEVNLVDRMLDLYPDLSGKFVFKRYTYISGNKIENARYKELFERVKERVNVTNLKHGRDDWVPIDYSFDKKLSDVEVAGLLCATDTLLIASIADGFNHLALEAIFSRRGIVGTQLVLSNIGVSDYLKGYRPLSGVLERDAKLLRKSLVSSRSEKAARTTLLRLTATRLTVEQWMRQVYNQLYELES